MLERFRMWYLNYQAEITFWVIGWLSYGVFDCLSTGNYVFAVINAVLVWVNFYMWRRYVR